MSVITQDRLMELLQYNEETGIFYRRDSGRIAGTKRPDGRINICVDCRLYRAHRLAWLWTNGEMPKGDIDHIDGNPQNNRISNLRDVSRSVNMQNQRRARSDSKTGLLGVQVHGKRFRAEIATPNGRVGLGTFNTPQEAHSVYLLAKRQLHDGCSI